jgi:hydroxyethylthiazole kinase
MAMYETDFESLLKQLRKKRPLVHHITNYVTVNDCANITLCIGGAPVMAEAKEEVSEMVSLSNALVLNIGTLRSEQVDAMLIAGRRANELGIPIILDPVGAGATKYRTETANHLLKELGIAVIKGNAGEIGVLAGTGGTVRGVDSRGAEGDPIEVASEYAQRIGSCVTISGPIDTISDGRRTLQVENGHEMMGTITGTGCMASSIVGAFAAISKDHVISSAAAMAAFGIAGERAASKASGPYSFKAGLFDETADLTPKELGKKARIRLA